MLHAGGPYYSETTPEKRAYWEAYYARRARRDAAKRALLRLPLFARLNARHGWFVPPVARENIGVANRHVLATKSGIPLGKQTHAVEFDWNEADDYHRRVCVSAEAGPGPRHGHRQARLNAPPAD